MRPVVGAQCPDTVATPGVGPEFGSLSEHQGEVAPGSPGLLHCCMPLGTGNVSPGQLQPPCTASLAKFPVPAPPKRRAHEGPQLGTASPSPWDSLEAAQMGHWTLRDPTPGPAPPRLYGRLRGPGILERSERAPLLRAGRAYLGPSTVFPMELCVLSGIGASRDRQVGLSPEPRGKDGSGLHVHPSSALQQLPTARLQHDLARSAPASPAALKPTPARTFSAHLLRRPGASSGTCPGNTLPRPLCRENSRACLSDADPIPGLTGNKGASSCMETAGHNKWTGPWAESQPRLGARCQGGHRRLVGGLVTVAGFQGQPVDCTQQAPAGSVPTFLPLLQS
ncbi:hypothetical protein AAY473_023225 [Plecturocebus cupreus]